METVDTSPGLTCAVTKHLTVPQMTVRINKQPGASTAVASSQPITEECGESCPDPSDPNVHFVGDSDENPKICLAVKFTCEKNQKLFTSATCGCGCIDTNCQVEPLCALGCQFGFAEDENGCMLCKCKQF